MPRICSTVFSFIGDSLLFSLKKTQQTTPLRLLIELIKSVISGLLRKKRSRNPTALRKSIRIKTRIFFSQSCSVFKVNQLIMQA
jgi:hypothetical protein